MSARSEPRFTRDIDLAVAVSSDIDAEHLVLQLLRNGWQSLGGVEQTATGRLATMRLFPPHIGPSVVVDLLFASSGIEPELVRQAEVLTLAGVSVPVARTGHLIALKVLSESRRRPQDGSDLMQLLSVADPAELRRANSALKLIERRGFARGKKLLAAYQKHLQRRFI